MRITAVEESTERRLVGPRSQSRWCKSKTFQNYLYFYLIKVHNTIHQASTTELFKLNASVAEVSKL